jgi:predicted nucleotidyltransferase component of viral defense system
MTKSQPVNLAASVYQRLLNLSHARGEEFNFLLARYAIERLLYRLSQSRYADKFVLKGALLFLVWAVPVHRPTRDLDLLGFGDGSAEHLARVFHEVCLLEVEPDGITFDPGTIQIRPIREEQEYGGQRITLTAQLGRARIAARVDVGFGDVVVPESVVTTYPTLLDLPAPQIRVYSRETLVAEKVHAIVTLDMTNSRMKDFFDLWTLARLFHFNSETLVQAIKATFWRRQTPLPQGAPTAFTVEFYESSDKIRQWQAFMRRNRIDTTDADLSRVVTEITAFLAPPLRVAAEGPSLSATWEPGGPWTEIN